MPPLFSIIIANYNMAEYLAESIASARSQRNSDFEIIIVDNASTDNSWEVICRFNDCRIKKFKQASNLGMYANLNVALMLANGKYAKILCADDVLHPMCLETIESVINQESTFNGPHLYIGHKITALPEKQETPVAWLIDPPKGGPGYKEMFLETGVPCGLPAVCVDTQAFLDFGGFGSPNPSTDFSRDMLRLGLFSTHCRVFQLEAHLVLERAHATQNRHIMPKRWQLNEMHELYSKAGLISNSKIKNELSSLAGRHLASAFKSLVKHRSASYLHHTILFSIKHRLVSIEFLKSFKNTVIDNLRK